MINKENDENQTKKSKKIKAEWKNIFTITSQPYSQQSASY